MPTTTRSASLFALLLVTACATGPMGPPLPLTDGSLLDDYKLVQGMTEGAVASEGVTRAELGSIINLDRSAVTALVSLANDNSDAARLRARNAIQALADYVASVRANATSDGPPGLSRSGAP